MRSKPGHLKYTDLAIYIDNTIYERDAENNPTGLKKMTHSEEGTVYNYLYNILKVLASKNRLFYNQMDLDDFSIRLAGQILSRLIDPKQNFSLRKDIKKPLGPVKSCLNYIKIVLPFAAVDFRKDNYQEVVTSEIQGEDNLINVKEYIEDNIRSEYAKTREQLFDQFLCNFCEYLDDVLENSIYKHNLKERNNLKISAILTTTNFLKLQGKYKNSSFNKRLKATEAQISNWKNYVIMWRTENTYITPQIVAFYVQKTFVKLIEEIDKEEHDSYLPEESVKAILSSALATYGLDQNDDD